jgi:hypothetical protein
MATTRERRKQYTTEVRWPVRILSDHRTIEGETRNISFDGIYICCDEPLKLNERFRMAISPPNRRSIGLTGRVIWSDMYGLDPEETAFAMGVSLVKISKRDRKHIADVFSGEAAV